MARRLRGLRPPERDRRAEPAGVAVLSLGAVGRARSARPALGFGDDMLRVGYLKGFMDGTLGSATAHLLDGSGVEITTGEELERVVRRAATAHFPAGRARDRRCRQPRGPRCLRGCAGRLGAAGPEAPDRARPAAGRRGRPAFRRPRRGGLGAVQPRAVRPRSGRPAVGGPRGCVRLPLTARRRHAAGQRLGRARGGAGPAGRNRRRRTAQPGRAPCLATRAGADHAGGSERRAPYGPAWLEGQEQRRGTLLPGRLADLVVLDRDPLACPPEELDEVAVLATMVGGRWTHRTPGGLDV